MTTEDFGKVWRLLCELWPNQSRDRSATVWRVGLEPYDMAAAADQIMRYARKNKFFPDLADITAGMPEETPPEKLRSDRERMERMIALLQAK